MRAATHQEPGAWGYGKIHGRLVAGPGGAVYGATYWGSHTDIAFDHGYGGDVLFRVDAEKGTIEPLGVPVPKQGIPSLASAPARGLIYGESVDPTANEKRGTFFAYDIAKRKVVFSSDTPEHDSFRSIAVDKAGKAYFSAGNNQLWVYDPDANTIAKLPARMPGVLLRAATAPAPDGTIYAATREPDALFALQPSGAIKELGPLPGYVASLGLDRDGSRVFYVPDAHGKAWEKGTPLMAVDTASGKSSEIVKLQPLLGDKLGLVLGGTYDVVVSPDGRNVYVGLNGGPDQKTTFGSVVLADVALPARP
jgi:DNA-binding beta-propeller fold protein YncE